MRNLHSEWREMNSPVQVQGTAEQIVSSASPDSTPQIHIIREVAESQPATQPLIIAAPNKSGFGPMVAGGLITIALAAGLYGGAYYYAERQGDNTLEEELRSDFQITEGNGQVQEIRNSSTQQINEANRTYEIQNTGCTRQLSAIGDIPGAFTRNGNSTDICWELGEVINNGFGASGVVTLWGESPHAGIIDDQLIHDKFLAGDISQEELVALFSSFVLNAVTDTELILLDRDRNNYIWETAAGFENVVVELSGGR